MNDIKVCFCDHDPLLRGKLAEFFAGSTEFDSFVFSEEDFFNRLDVFDAAVIDLGLPDFKEIYRELTADGTKLIITYEDDLDHRNLLSVLPHNAALCRPFSLNDLQTLLRSQLPTPEKYRLSSSKSVDEKLSNIFIRAGIPPHIKGYQYLRTAVKLAITQPDIVNSITKKLYPTVAEYYDTTPSKVERAIRHAIEVAWSRGKIENINAIFGIKIYSKGDKPTNGELIALIADKMVIELM